MRCFCRQAERQGILQMKTLKKLSLCDFKNFNRFHFLNLNARVFLLKQSESTEYKTRQA